MDPGILNANGTNLRTQSWHSFRVIVIRVELMWPMVKGLCSNEWGIMFHPQERLWFIFGHKCIESLTIFAIVWSKIVIDSIPLTNPIYEPMTFNLVYPIRLNYVLTPFVCVCCLKSTLLRVTCSLVVTWMRSLSLDARDFVVDGVVVWLAMQLPE